MNPELYASPGKYLEKPSSQAPFSDDTRIHEWPGCVRGQGVLFYRSNTDVLIRITGIADFLVSETGEEVRVTPVPAVSLESIDDAYQNLVVPLMLSQQQKLVFHASAVVIEDFSVVFMAQSGTGKSTLASSLVANGFPLLADDHVWIDSLPSGFQAMPGPVSMRLWQDSYDRLGAALPGGAATKNSIDKWQIALDVSGGKGPGLCREPRWLKHIYFLATGPDVSIRPLSQQETVVRLLKHQFLLNMANRHTLIQNLTAVTQIARDIAAFEFLLPHDFEQLEAARHKILEHAKESEPLWAATSI